MTSVNNPMRSLVKQLQRLPLWVGRMFMAVLRRTMADGVTGTASQFAYNAFLATIPFLFVLVTAIRLAGPDAYLDIFKRLEDTIPGISGLAGAFQQATASGAAGGVVIGLASIAGLYVSSNAIGALVDGLDRAQRLPHRKWVRAKAYNMVLAAGTIVLALLGVLSLSGGQRLMRGITDLLGGGADLRGLVDSITLPLGLLLIFAFTLLLYRFGPNEMRLGFRSILPGALLSTAAWYGTNTLVGLYAKGFNDLKSVYGALGAIFVYLTFLYFSGLMFLVGAELNAELVHRRLQRAARGTLVAPTLPAHDGITAETVPAVVSPNGADGERDLPADPDMTVAAGRRRASEPAPEGATREIEWP